MSLLGKSIALLCSAAMLLSAGCKRNSVSSVHVSGHLSRIDPATAGTVEGTVHLAGKAPERIAIDMAQDPACNISSDSNNLTEGIVAAPEKGKEAGLANVFVYVKDGLGDKVYPPTIAPVVLDQKGCRYTPHVLAAMVGQPVEFRNSDPTMHNIHMQPTVGGNQQFDVSQPPNGGTTRHSFAQPELMIPVRCNNHPWMQAFLNIAPNPFFSVTGADGHFTIQGLPPGTYTLVADQEQLGQQQATVTITTHNTAVANFTFQSR